LNKGVSWEQCKTRLLDEFFSHFVRDRLIWDLIIFNFHEKAQSLRTYIDQVFTAASFLRYNAAEQQLVGCIVINFHPTILAQVAFLERPWSRKELYRAVGLIEEFSFMKERQQIQPAVSASRRGDLRLRDTSRNVLARSHPPKCWNCGNSGHTRCNCHQTPATSGNGQLPGGHQTPGRQF